MVVPFELVVESSELRTRHTSVRNPRKKEVVPERWGEVPVKRRRKIREDCQSGRHAFGVVEIERKGSGREGGLKKIKCSVEFCQ